MPVFCWRLCAGALAVWTTESEMNALAPPSPPNKHVHGRDRGAPGWAILRRAGDLQGVIMRAPVCAMVVAIGLAAHPALAQADRTAAAFWKTVQATCDATAAKPPGELGR